jgi:nicotinamide mononucleotide adenylyltransferase
MSDSTNETANGLTEYWAKLDKLPEDLRDLVNANWDYTGRPITDHPVSNIVIALLNKNMTEGFKGFEKDMNLVFEDKKYNSYDLAMFYNIHVAGAKLVSDHILSANKTNKNKM